MSFETDRPTAGEQDDRVEPTCDAFRERMVSCLDGEISPAGREELEEHLASCPECERLMGLHRQVGELLDVWAAPGRQESAGDPSSTLRDVKRRVRSRRRNLYLSAAAALIVSVTVLLVSLTDFQAAPTGEDLSIIRDLDLLETLQEEGGDVSPELVDLLLDEVEGSDTLDTHLFDYLLEEEVSQENL